MWLKTYRLALLSLRGVLPTVVAAAIVDCAESAEPPDTEIVPPSSTVGDDLHALITLLKAHGRTNGPSLTATVAVVVATVFAESANDAFCGATDDMTRNRRSFRRIRVHSMLRMAFYLRIIQLRYSFVYFYFIDCDFLSHEMGLGIASCEPRFLFLSAGVPAAINAIVHFFAETKFRRWGDLC